ncbi:hypothetical protein AB0D49_40725 [Streptomyces sp. NPDC048290]|uniref:hypothetical protein n=1 Tax=Streptomyces sp. NPDC048290 TaxID=3155811 RepID=UPI003439EA4D
MPASTTDPTDAPAPPAPPFQLAAVFDGADPESGPWFDPEHPLIDDPELREQILAFLEAGDEVLFTPALMDDVLAPGLGAVVPLGYRTDGLWVWTESVAYYLREYGLAPEAGLLAHILDRGGPGTEVDEDTVRQAAEFILTPPDDDTGPFWTP